MFFAIVGVVIYYASQIEVVGPLAIIGYFGLGLIFLPLSQIRGVLLKLNETGSLEIQKINPTIKLMLRFFGIALTIPAAASLSVLAVVYFLGYTEGINLQGLFDDPISLFSKAFSEPVLLIAIALVPLFYFFCFTSCMVPFAAIASNLGNPKFDYDPFFGFGAYRYRAFMLTFTVLIIDIVIVGITLTALATLLPAELFITYESAAFSEIPIAAFFVLGFSYLALVFVQNIWFSSCALLFALYKEDAQGSKDAEVAQMYGHVFDDNELRSLRKSREAR